jgi:L-fuculose-phosphate aldolase
MDETKLREEMVQVMRAMAARGLNRGTSGNLSVRFGEGLLVTPSGVVPDALTPEGMVKIDAEGTAHGALRPSSEWRMHQGLLLGRSDVNAVVHCHSRHATILACAHKPIPAVHYMVGVSGGPSVPVAPYEPFGSAELAQGVVAALDGRFVCLMANHGQIAIAPNLWRALAIAEEIEEQAAIYWGALQIGGPALLTDEQMNEVLGRFRTYGQARRAH